MQLWRCTIFSTNLLTLSSPTLSTNRPLNSEPATLYKLNKTAQSVSYVPEIRHRVPIRGGAAADSTAEAPIGIPLGIPLELVEQVHYYTSIAMGVLTVIISVVWIALVLVNAGTDVQSARYLAYFLHMRQSIAVGSSLVSLTHPAPSPLFSSALHTFVSVSLSIARSSPALVLLYLFSSLLFSSLLSSSLLIFSSSPPSFPPYARLCEPTVHVYVISLCWPLWLNFFSFVSVLDVQFADGDDACRLPGFAGLRAVV